MQIRYRLAHDGKLLSDVLRIFLRVVNGWYRRQARVRGIKNSPASNARHQTLGVIFSAAQPGIKRQPSTKGFPSTKGPAPKARSDFFPLSAEILQQI